MTDWISFIFNGPICHVFVIIVRWDGRNRWWAFGLELDTIPDWLFGFCSFRITLIFFFR
ncbi:hypothetical protein QBC43DRAFT_315791, partial [Cladorrhinum sp. PSN259]